MPLKILMLAAIFGVPLIPTFWSILDIPKRRFATHKKKMLWFFVVATLPFIGGLIYILFVRRTTQPLENS
jgi:hypothetical protein